MITGVAAVDHPARRAVPVAAAVLAHRPDLRVGQGADARPACQIAAEPRMRTVTARPRAARAHRPTMDDVARGGRRLPRHGVAGAQRRPQRQPAGRSRRSQQGDPQDRVRGQPARPQPGHPAVRTRWRSSCPSRRTRSSRTRTSTSCCAAAPRRSAEHDITLLLTVAGTSEDRKRIGRYVTAGHVDGALLISTHTGSPLLRRAERARACRSWPAAGRSATSATAQLRGRRRPRRRPADGRATCARAGRRRIATITGPLDTPGGVDRLAGYHDVLGETDPRLVVSGDYTQASGEAAMEQLLRQAPDLDAVFVCLRPDGGRRDRRAATGRPAGARTTWRSAASTTPRSPPPPRRC